MDNYGNNSHTQDYAVHFFTKYIQQDAIIWTSTRPTEVKGRHLWRGKCVHNTYTYSIVCVMTRYDVYSVRMDNRIVTLIPLHVHGASHFILIIIICHFYGVEPPFLHSFSQSFFPCGVPSPFRPWPVSLPTFQNWLLWFTQFLNHNFFHNIWSNLSIRQLH